MNTQTKKSEETKSRIIRSAGKLFHKKGFEATSVREIVEDAGCAKGTFYLYFETKVDLLIYITNEICKVIDDILSKELSVMSDDPFRQIDSVFNNICHCFKETDTDYRLIHTNEVLAIISEKYLDDHFINVVISRIINFIDLGIRRGFFRELDPVLYSKIIFSISHQIIESVMLYEYPADAGAVSKELSVIMRKILEK